MSVGGWIEQDEGYLVYAELLHLKKEWYLVALAHPNASLDGVGVNLKVKVSQSNDDLAC